MSIEKIEENSSSVYNKILILFFDKNHYQDSFNNYLTKYQEKYLKIINKAIIFQKISDKIKNIELNKKSQNKAINDKIHLIKNIERTINIHVNSLQEVNKYKCYLVTTKDLIRNKIENFKPKSIIFYSTDYSANKKKSLKFKNKFEKFLEKNNIFYELNLIHQSECLEGDNNSSDLNSKVLKVISDSFL